MRVPYLGECLQYFALARMSWTLAVRLTDVDGRPRGNRVVRGGDEQRLLHAARAADSRCDFAGTTHPRSAASELYPPIFVNAIEAGETAGQLNATLEYLSAASIRLVER